MNISLGSNSKRWTINTSVVPGEGITFNIRKMYQRILSEYFGIRICCAKITIFVDDLLVMATGISDKDVELDSIEEKISRIGHVISGNTWSWKAIDGVTIYNIGFIVREDYGIVRKLLYDSIRFEDILTKIEEDKNTERSEYAEICEKYMLDYLVKKGWLI